MGQQPEAQRAVFVVGASSVGKTTLCNAIARELQVEPARWIRETAREVMRTQGFSRDTTHKIMRQHIDTLGSRYKGKIHEWDVLNEAIAQNGGTSPNYRTGGTSRWYDRVGGIDYADSAFKWAQQVDTTLPTY